MATSRSNASPWRNQDRAKFSTMPPSALAVSPAGMAVTRSPIQLLRWLAVPVATLGLILAFFGLTWRSAVEAGAGIAVLTVSALIWRGFGGR